MLTHGVASTLFGEDPSLPGATIASGLESDDSLVI